MVETALLEQTIKDAGYTIAEFAKEVQISRSSFYLKKDNKRDFTSREIGRICERLGLDIFAKDQIFFAKYVA